MTIYIEAVIFDNFALDYLLATLTCGLTKREKRRGLCALSAMLGSAFALVLPLVQRFVVLFKIFVLLCCSAAFYMKRNFKGYVVNTFVYAVLSFALCGIMQFVIGADGYVYKKGGLVGVISLSVLLFLYTVRQVNGLIQSKKINDKFVTAVLINKQKSVKVTALVDSGNLLVDGKGNGIVLSDANAILPLGELERCGEVNITTPSGKGTLSCVKVQCVKIYYGKREDTLSDVTVALTKLPKNYSLILPCA